MNKVKEYRFFYHYYKQKGKMSIHFRNSCTIVGNIECNVPCETKWKNSQPRLIMQGFCKEVKFENGKAIIQ
jgi:hypothetical protein